MSKLPDNTNFTNLTEREWTEFLSHRLPPEKEAAFIQQSQGNEFLQEALEGINEIENRSHVLSSVNNINARIKEKVGSSVETKLAPYHFNYVQIGAIAAIFIVVIGIGSAMFYFMNTLDNEHVAQTNAVTVMSSEPAAPMVTSDATVLSGGEPHDSAIVALNESSAKDTVDVDKNAATPVLNATQTIDKREESGDLAKTNIPPKTNQVMASSTSADKITKAAEKSPTTVAGYTKAADFKTTIAPTVAKNEPSSATMNNYRKGISAMDKGNNEEAEKIFDREIEQNTQYKEDAKWNKVQILLKKGEAKKAVKILKELTGNQNPYKNRAEELLKKLE